MPISHQPNYLNNLPGSEDRRRSVTTQTIITGNSWQPSREESDWLQSNPFLDSPVMPSPQEARQQTNIVLRYNRVLMELNTNFHRRIRLFQERNSNLEQSPSNEIPRRIGRQQGPSPEPEELMTARQMYISSTIGR